MKSGIWRSGRKLFGMPALATLIAVLLSACQTNQGPSAEELAASTTPDIEAAGFTGNDRPRVKFLEPIGDSSPVAGALSTDLNLEIVIFSLDPATGLASGTALAPGLSTKAGTITETNGTYSAVWDVPETAPMAEGGYVRVEIRPAGVPKDLPISPSGPYDINQVCNVAWGACLGYFDARIVGTGSGTNTPPSATTYVNVPDHATVQITFKVLAGTALPPAEMSGLVGMASQGANLDEQAGNCSSNDFQGLQAVGAGLQAVGAGLQAVGAGLQAVGAVGGLFVADPDKVTGRVVSNETIAEQLLAGMGRSNIKNYGALLIVDEFDGVFELPQALLDGNDLDVGDLDALFESGVLSHGALVLHQVKQLAAAATGDTKAKTRGTETEYRSARGTRLLVKAVDAHDLDTEQLAGAIRSAVDSLSDDYRHVVVNMSFAIVPCAVNEDVGDVIGTGAIATFEEYVASLMEVNAIDADYVEAVGQLASLPVELETDPLFLYLDCPLPNGNRCDGIGAKGQPLVDSLVHVASSGNFGNDYPLFPAALPTVISVGSLDADGAGYSAARSSFSNEATVLAPGALLQLADKSTQQIVYAGTSFAAPVVSLFAALDQMSQTPLCDAGSLAADPITGHVMADYEDETDVPLVSTFTTGADNALSKVCGN